MNKILKKLFVAILSLGVVFSSVGVSFAENTDEYSDTDFDNSTVIVKMKPSIHINSAPSSYTNAANVFGDLAISDVQDLNPCRTKKNEISVQTDSDSTQAERGDVLLLELSNPGRESVLNAIESLKDNVNIESVMPNFIITLDDFDEVESNIAPLSITPNDTYFSNLWGLNIINAPGAWDYSTGSSVVTVGVVDTGVDFNHEDLMSNVWINEGEIENNGIDDDNNGYIDDICGWDFYNNDNKPEDNNSHGTHVAGTIAAKGNNGKGVAGVSWNTKIAGLKFMDVDSTGTHGTADNAIKALDYAEAMGIDITNNSWTMTNSYSYFLPFVEDYTNLTVVAAGNDASELTGDYSSFDRSRIIVVASTTASDTLSSFSNYSSINVDVAAPGSSIYSCLPNDKYGYKSGTSMATPHVAGAAALLKSYNQSLSSAQLKTRILNKTDVVSTLNGKVAGNRRLNVYKLFTN